MKVLGIDPGWKNLGLAIVEEVEKPFRVKVNSSAVLDVSSGTEGWVDKIGELDDSIDSVCIERYVPYAGIREAESENINMTIGMIRMKFFLSSGKPPVYMYRAFDWKVKIIQILSKYSNFENPSSQLDKKFSLYAAKFITENENKITTHEADAICIAALPIFEDQIKRGICIGEKEEK